MSISSLNTCYCTAKSDHREILCTCSCHPRIRREAALAGWRTRRRRAAQERKGVER